MNIYIYLQRWRKRSKVLRAEWCGSEIEKQGCFIPFPFWRVIRSSIVNKAAQFSAHSRCYSMLDRLSNESKRRTTRRGLQLVVGGRTRWTNSLESRFRVKMKIAQKTPVPFFSKAAWQARRERERKNERARDREREIERQERWKDGILWEWEERKEREWWEREKMRERDVVKNSESEGGNTLIYLTI